MVSALHAEVQLLLMLKVFHCGLFLRRDVVHADVVATTDVEEACKDVDIAVMLGGFPRKAGMERKDVMSKNVSIYAAQVPIWCTLMLQCRQIAVST